MIRTRALLLVAVASLALASACKSGNGSGKDPVAADGAATGATREFTPRETTEKEPPAEKPDKPVREAPPPPPDHGW